MMFEVAIDVFLGLSLALNVALAVGWWASRRIAIRARNMLTLTRAHLRSSHEREARLDRHLEESLARESQLRADVRSIHTAVSATWGQA